MCLVVFAWRYLPGLQLALAGNRDEFHGRPTAPLGWWDDPPLLAGRDLSAGGTWLGVDAGARFGVITNFRGASTPAAAPSRGTLIPSFLASNRSPAECLGALAADRDRYAGFSLLVGNKDSLAYFCNRDPAPPRLLLPGVYGLSNSTLDTPWPKLVQSRARLAGLLERGQRKPEQLLEVITDRARAPDAELPDTGVGIEIERRLSPAFIVGADYGTRSSTALLLRSDGGGTLLERCFDAGGTPVGSRRFELQPRHD